MASTKIRSKQQFEVNSDLDFGSAYRISNALDAVSAQDYVTLSQLNAVQQGLDVHASVRAATTVAGGNITLSGTQTVDGVALSVGNRVLVKNQSTGANNGIYVVASGTWTRATDADTSAEVTPGLFTFVEEGSTNGDTGWLLTTDAPITLGTTALTFTQFSGAGSYTAGSGLTLTGGSFSVNTDGVTTAIVSNNLIVRSTGTSGQTLLSSGTAGTAATWGALNLASSNAVTGILGLINGGTAANLSVTGGANMVLQQSSVGGAVTVAQLTASQIGSGAALTKTDDTNVTLTLGGTPASALLAATSLTLGWTGTLSRARGGTGTGTATTDGQLLIGNSATGNWSVATLTQGTGVTITNGNGTITISASGTYSNSNFVTRETPTGTVNGVNATFTLANTPTAGSEEVFVNGQLQTLTNDYTIATNTITFVSGSIPQTGDIVRVNYRK